MIFLKKINKISIESIKDVKLLDIQTLINNSNLNISKERILFNEPMKKHSTFKIGGPAQCLIKVETISELKEILRLAKENNIKITVIGNGSNLLVLDGGIEGITLEIKFEKYELIENKSNVEAIVEAGCKLGKLAQIFLQNEISGFEELSGIPGTIGGTVKMNAGAYGKEMKDIVEEVVAIDFEGNERVFYKDELNFGYRTSIFQTEKYIITKVKMNLNKGHKEEIKNKMTEYLNSRKEKQPIEYPSAGSTFKRGNDFITAKLIDEAGLKGYSVKDAMVSTKHSGFIINKGNATAKDVIKLVNYIKEEIYNKFGKEIELEVEVIGKDK